MSEVGDLYLLRTARQQHDRHAVDLLHDRLLQPLLALGLGAFEQQKLLPMRLCLASLGDAVLFLQRLMSIIAILVDECEPLCHS